MSKKSHSVSSSDKECRSPRMSDRKNSKKSKKNMRNYHKHRSESRRSCSDSDSEVVCLRKFKWHIIKGDKGDSGTKGDTGPKGSRGKRGHKGSDGPRGCKGSPGHKGPEGPRGKRGCDGRGGILAYSFATVANSEGDIPSGSSIKFNNTEFPSLDITTDGTLFTLEKGGVYEIDYMVQGVSSDPSLPLQYAVIANGSVVVFGSTFSSSTGSNSVVQGTLLASFPDISHGITTGDGTTLELKNMSANTILTGTGSNSAYLKITRIA